VGEVRFEVQGAVASIVLDNQSKMNAIDAHMDAQLAGAYARIDHDDDIRVAVILGAGERAFSSGGDMASYVAAGALGSEGTGVPTPIPKPMGIWKPFIAALQGHCLAGGFGLALSCDLRIAADNLSMGPTGLRRGVIPGGQQIQRLVKLTSYSEALAVLLRSKPITAQEAFRMGLVHEVVSPEELEETAFQWAHDLSKFDPRAVSETKRQAFFGLTMGWLDAFSMEAEAMKRSFQSDSALQGFQSFLSGDAKSGKA
jgi:enoyl-CoA hydratase/carnithine racemase